MLDQRRSSEQTMAPDAPAAGSYTTAALLERLRTLEAQLYSPEVVEAVKAAFKDDPDQQLAFAQARLDLTATIATLNASQLREIREDLQAEAEELHRGVDELAGAFGRLEAAVGWAKALNGVISVVERIVSLV